MTSQHLAHRLCSKGAAALVRRVAARRTLVTAAASSNSEWSGILSFASPDSDFSSGALPHSSEWSSSLSFASPESDFQYGSLEKHDAEWSESYSYASPEADFYQSAVKQEMGPTWSESLSFASPEADYTARVDVHLAQEALDEEQEWSHDLSFASPDADFTSASLHQEPSKQDYVNHVMNDEHLRDSMAYSLSFAAAETDFCSNAFQDLMDDRMKEQLRIAESQLMVDMSQLPLPRSLQEAEQDTKRAIVITKPTAPFEIVDVNEAWVGLCGYSKEESRHQTLKILQGPETNANATKFLLDELLHGKEASTVLTNYTKSGRKFHNRVRVGPLMDVHNQVTHFVGVLEEITDLEDHWKEVNVNAA